MSIINQMLKDLENRTRKRGSGTENPDPVIMRVPSRSQKIKRVFFSLLILAGILLAVDLYVIVSHWIGKQVASQRTPVRTAVTKAVVTMKSIVPLESGPINLTGVTVEVSHNTTQLRFLLSQAAFYRISTDALATTYVITLEHTRLSTEPPLIASPESALDALKMTNLPDNSLQIYLRLKKGARLQQAGIFSGVSPEFQIMLVYAPPIQPPASLGKLPAPVLSPSAQKNSFAEQSLQTAKHLVTQGEIEKAVSLLKSVTVISPGFHPARETLIRLLMQRGRMDEAGEVLQVGLARYPQWLPYVDLQARWLAERGQTGAALALLSQYTPILRDHPDYYGLMAALYQRHNQPQMAATLYQQLIASNPHNAKWWLGFAIALDGSDRHAEAMNAYRRASEEEGTGLSPELKAWIETQLHPM